MRDNEIRVTCKCNSLTKKLNIIYIKFNLKLRDILLIIYYILQQFFFNQVILFDYIKE